MENVKRFRVEMLEIRSSYTPPPFSSDLEKSQNWSLEQLGGTRPPPPVPSLATPLVESTGSTGRIHQRIKRTAFLISLNNFERFVNNTISLIKIAQ